MIEQLIQADAVLADKAYDADERVRKRLVQSECQAVIPPKKNRLKPANYDKDLYLVTRPNENHRHSR